LYIEGQAELGYRLSQRVALMLGQSQKERKLIFEKMTAFYRKRGAIVHGASISLTTKEVSTLRDYVHRSITSFLDLKALGMNKKDILDLLNVAWESGRPIEELLKSE
jgi:hypothetical protein